MDWNGATTHAAVAGLYAWVVTVAPVLWEPGLDGGNLVVARLAAALALVAILAGTAWGDALEGRARLAANWSFVLASALAWLAAPEGIRPARVDGARGLAGMLGWGLFALASAGPSLGPARESGRLLGDAPLEARRSLARGDALYLAAGAATALALQLAGWSVPVPERALLVRLVALASGLAVIGASAQLALARHAPRAPRSPRARLLGSRLPLAILGALALAGLLLASRG